MEFLPVTGVLGAFVGGVDLTGPLTDAEVDELYQGLIAHEVLFFRNQPLSPTSHLALAEASERLIQATPSIPTSKGSKVSSSSSRMLTTRPIQKIGTRI